MIAFFFNYLLFIACGDYTSSYNEDKMELSEVYEKFKTIQPTFAYFNTAQLAAGREGAGERAGTEGGGTEGGGAWTTSTCGRSAWSRTTGSWPCRPRSTPTAAAAAAAAAVGA